MNIKLLIQQKKIDLKIAFRVQGRDLLAVLQRWIQLIEILWLKLEIYSLQMLDRVDENED